MYKRVMVISILISCSGMVGAEPSSVVRYLMKEPVTMWDWGLYQLEKKLNERFEGKPGVYVSYDWDANRLVLSAMRLSPENIEIGIKQWGKDICALEIDQMRRYLGVDAQTGKARIDDESFLVLNFIHTGFSNPSQPANLGIELDNMTRLRARVRGKDLKNEKWAIECEGPLLGTNTDIFYSRWKKE